MYRVLFANYGKSVLLNKTCLKELNTSTDTFDEIVREVFEDDKMINAQKVLDTNYTRNKYIMENFNYVSPHEIILYQSEVNMGLPFITSHSVRLSRLLLKIQQ